MAEKKNTQATEKKEIKPIVLKDSNGEVYVLEFDRASVKFAEQRGFDTGAESLTITGMEELFFYAFRKHHPKLSKADTDKILYEKLHGFPKGMVDRLAELFALPYEALVQTEEASKNATMTAEF